MRPAGSVFWRRIGPTFVRIVVIALLAGTVQAQDLSARLHEADRLRSSDNARFASLLEDLNREADQATQEEAEFLAYLNAYQAAYRGDFANAIEAADTIFHGSASDELRFRAGALLANSYAASVDSLRALRHLEVLFELRSSVRDPEIALAAPIVAAVLYNQIGQFELGLRYAEEVQASTTVERTRCFSAFNRAEALQHLGRWPQNEENVESDRRHCLAHAEPVLAGMIGLLQIRERVAQGDAKTALDGLLAELPAMEATGFPRLLAEAHHLAAELYLDRGETDSAQHHATLAASQSPGIAYSRPVVAAHRILYEIAEAEGDVAAAFAHYKRYSEADRAYLDSVKAREIAYQTVRHEIQQKDQTIELLNRRNDVLKLEQQVARTAAQNTTLLAALLALLLAAIGYWAYKTKRLQLAFRRLAETDALTGIGNRLHFTRESEAALAFCARSREPVSLVMFDLDYFKSINDHYGHATGDWVLRQVTGVVAGLCRKGDRFGRLGGEEFAILLIGCELAQAERMAESCRAAIAAIDTRPGGASFGLSASFGVASTVAAGYSLDHLLSQADQALYAAKRGGRNRVAVAREAAPSHADVSA